MSARRFAAPATALLAIAASAVFLISGHLTSQAIQNPTISLDMITAGTTYDDSTNTMSVGTVQNTSTGSQSLNHVHATHLVINNVEDLVGWQVRLNYTGDRMRPVSQSTTPFTDNTTAQTVGFTNLPIDQSTLVHRDVTSAASIPAAPPDNTNTPQTALIGATYLGPQDFALSPDTPAKAVPDDSSYSAPSGGILSQLTLGVVGNECNTGPMTMDLDDGSPNPPGSQVVVFDGAGTTGINLTEGQLFDATHTEVCASASPTSSPSPSPSPSASPSPTPSPNPAGHDARLTRISGVPKNVRLSPGEVINDSASVVVANESTHSDTIGVYVDVMAPPGCTPSGRILETTVTLAAGAKTTIPVFVNYTCANPAFANGLSYTWVAVADHGGDNLAACGPGSLQGISCFNALADDDQDPADNRLSRNGPRVVAQ